jgi:hypothetical protein
LGSILVAFSHEQAVTQKLSQESPHDLGLFHIVRLMDEDIGQRHGIRRDELVGVKESPCQYQAIIFQFFHHLEVSFALGRLCKTYFMAHKWQKSSTFR